MTFGIAAAAIIMMYFCRSHIFVAFMFIVVLLFIGFILFLMWTTDPLFALMGLGFVVCSLFLWWLLNKAINSVFKGE